MGPGITMLPGRSRFASVRADAFSELYVAAHRVGQKSDSDSESRNLSVRNVEFHSVCLKLLAEGLQVLHFESDVVDRAPFGGGPRRVFLETREGQIHGGDIRGDREVAAIPGHR